MNPSVYHWIEITDKFIICFAYFAFTQIYLKLWEYYNFGTKNSRNAWHVIPAQEVNETVLVLGTWRVLNAINVTQTERIIVSGCHTENCNKARFPTEFKKTLNSFLTGKIKSYEFRGEASILRISSTSQWQIFEFSIATKYPTIRGKIITLCTARSFFFFSFLFSFTRSVANSNDHHHTAVSNSSNDTFIFPKWCLQIGEWLPNGGCFREQTGESRRNEFAAVARSLANFNESWNRRMGK